MRSLRRHLVGEGVFSCSQLSWFQLFSYQASISQLAPSSRHHRLLLIRQVRRFLEGCGWGDRGLERAIRRPPLPPHHPGPGLSLQDQLLLISAAPSRRIRLQVSVRLATGARPGELLDDCCQWAALPKISPHQLRHAACARWLRCGVPLLLVSKLLGRARPSTALDHYASVISQDLEQGLSLDPLTAGLGAISGAAAANQERLGVPTALIGSSLTPHHE